MMKKLLLLFVTATSVLSCAVIGKQSINQEQVLQAGMDLVTSFTISDAQVMQLTGEAIAKMDSQSKIAASNTSHAKRLAKLTQNLRSVGGRQFNYKVYMTDEINAFACADGSIRIYSGLMDVMSDEELTAIIGHEIGHVMNNDTRDAMRKAYQISAGRNALGSFNESTLGKMSNSILGELAQLYLGAQFSQKQEFEADDYGFKVSVANGYSPYAMSNSLQKLVSISGGASAPKLAQMFSSHPDSAKRAARMKTAADNYKK